MSADMVRNLLQEFGHSIGIPDLQVDEEGRCNLLFDDVAVSFEFSQDEESVYLYSYLATAPEVDLEKFYATLLEANYLFRGTNGATLGVEAMSKRVVLIREERLELMRLAQFESVVGGFVNLAENWKKKLVNWTAEPAADESSFDQTQEFGTHALKV